MSIAIDHKCDECDRNEAEYCHCDNCYQELMTEEYEKGYQQALVDEKEKTEALAK